MFLNLYHSLSLLLFYLLGVDTHLKSGLDSLNLTTTLSSGQINHTFPWRNIQSTNSLLNICVACVKVHNFKSTLLWWGGGAIFWESVKRSVYHTLRRDMTRYRFAQTDRHHSPPPRLLLTAKQFFVWHPQTAAEEWQKDPGTTTNSKR